MGRKGMMPSAAHTLVRAVTRIDGTPLIVAVIACLMSVIVAAQVPRSPLPVVSLLQSVSEVTATPPYSREASIRWSARAVSAAITRPFAVRHRVEFFPGDAFEIVFDTRLATYRGADSFAGIALNDPGSTVVFTHYRQALKLTVDSPMRGHYSVQTQSDGSTVARKYTGLNARHGADDFGDAQSHLTHVNNVLPTLGPLIEAAETALADYVKDGFCIRIGLGIGFGGSGGAADVVRAPVPAAGPASVSGRGGSGVGGLFGVLAGVLIENFVSGGCKKPDTVARREEIDALEARVTGLRQQKLRYQEFQTRLRREVAQRPARLGVPLASKLVVTSPAQFAAPSANLRLGALDGAPRDIAELAANGVRPMPSWNFTADSFMVGADCQDTPGRIDVAIVASTKTVTTWSSIESDPNRRWVAIVHALDLSNAALRNSNVSTPGLDVGFAITNISGEPIPVEISVDPSATGGTTDDSAYNVYQRFWPPTSAPGDFYPLVDVRAPTADVVVVIVEGDGKPTADRGYGTATRDVVGDKVVDRRLAVVKRSVLDHVFFYTLAHELGHTIGGGHDDPKEALFHEYAHGAVVAEDTQRWASLMAKSDCPENPDRAGNADQTCRRVPYYSSSAISLPGYGGQQLGGPNQDNASAMRLIRDNVARLQCSQGKTEKVWLQKGPADINGDIAKRESALEPDRVIPTKIEAWEAQSIWVGTEPFGREDLLGRDAYQHRAVAGGNLFFPTILIHNGGDAEASGALEVWRQKADKNLEGLLLSPAMTDMELLSNCGNPNNGSVTLNRKKAVVLQLRCSDAPRRTGRDFSASRDAWAVRWTGAGAQQSDAGSPAISAMVESNPTMAWRSMREIDLACGEESQQVVLVRNTTSSLRHVNVRIEAVPNQYNFEVRHSGLNKISVDNRYCRTEGSSNCEAASTAKDALDARTKLELKLPVGAVVPITLNFGRNINMPQQNVLLRVFEDEFDPSQPIVVGQTPKIVGGTSYVIRHRPKLHAGAVESEPLVGYSGKCGLVAKRD